MLPTQDTIDRAVNNNWLTVLARGSMILVTCVMIPTGAALISLVIWLYVQQGAMTQWQRNIEEWKAGTNVSIAANEARIETLISAIAEGASSNREMAAELRALNSRVTDIVQGVRRLEESAREGDRRGEASPWPRERADLSQ